MRKKIEQIEADVNMFLEYLRKEFFKGNEDEFEFRKKSLVHISQTKIIKIEKEKE
jgi:MerR family transcriptional regulator/heat shock protein HspR